MGYDRNDIAMTCGERDDREVPPDELAEFLREVMAKVTEPEDIAGSLLLVFNIYRA